MKLKKLIFATFTSVLLSTAVVHAEEAAVTAGSNTNTESASLLSTGIENMASEDASKTSVFNFNGERLSVPSKGLNIIDGKKVMVK